MRSPRATLEIVPPVAWQGMLFSEEQLDLINRALTTAFEKVVEETIHCYVLTDEQRQAIDTMLDRTLRFHATIQIAIVPDSEAARRMR